MRLFSPRKDGEEHPKSIGTVIGADACLEGTLTTRNSVCIEGTVRGELRSEGHVVLNRGGTLEADVVAQCVSINGSVRGNIRALKQLDIGETGVIHGDVEAAVMTIAKGGVLDGTCRVILPENEPERPNHYSTPGRLSPDNAGYRAADEREIPEDGLIHSEDCLMAPEA
jgi:cytoskeletal protein CcmA (bactofilin family)